MSKPVVVFLDPHGPEVIPVAITAGANAVPVAEFTLLLALAVLRRLSYREAQLRAGEWQRAREETRTQAQQLRGKIVALVGMGAIGAIPRCSSRGRSAWGSSSPRP